MSVLNFGEEMGLGRGQVVAGGGVAPPPVLDPPPPQPASSGMSKLIEKMERMGSFRVGPSIREESGQGKGRFRDGPSIP
jgi:hypothetical protein